MTPDSAGEREYQIARDFILSQRGKQMPPQSDMDTLETAFINSLADCIAEAIASARREAAEQERERCAMFVERSQVTDGDLEINECGLHNDHLRRIASDIRKLKEL